MQNLHNRRSFLKLSAATGGGMMLGFSWLVSCTHEAEALTATTEILPGAMPPAPEEWFPVNAFLKIGDNGVVTIFSPNPEIGQNVKTSMPMIVAEELDVDWKDVVVEQAPLDTDKYTRQLAGGSQSIRQGWEGLRRAGATARMWLLTAAAERLKVDVTALTTKGDGRIYHETSGQSLGYGEVASATANLPIPENVPLKDPKDFRIIGKGKRNVDALKIVTGQPLFGLDLNRENMQIAMIVHPPAFGLKLKAVDESSIAGMPGINKVVTINAAPKGFDPQWSDTNAFPELVAVIGRSTWEVMQAKKALQVEWKQVSAPEDSASHDTMMANLLEEKGKEARRDGNPEAAFAGATQIIERTYTAPFLAHNTMEPMNFFAHVTNDRAILEGPIQTPEFLRKSIADLLDMPEEQVSIMMTRMGGGFGRRLYGNFGVEAALISQEAGVPVKLIYTREDDMTQGTYRPDYKVTYRAALNAENELTGLHIRGTGTNGSPVFANRFPAGTIDNYLVEKSSLESNISTGAWRAPRSNFIAGAEQSFLDEVAEIMGKDPIDWRLELFERAKTNPVGNNNDYDPERYAGVLKLVKEKANWGTEKSGVHRGVAAYYCHNSYVAQVVDVVMESNKPRVDKVWCAVDCGIVVNPEGALNQIEGGIIDGIGHAMYSAMTFKDGAPEQQNFDRYRLIRHREAPRSIEVFFVDNGVDPTGLGEPSLPPVIAALANALASATGERLYTQPFVSQQEILG